MTGIIGERGARTMREKSPLAPRLTPLYAGFTCVH
ncbi:hypothetical protein RLIN73S_00309 [Rhodanobacter lindaniclasticus]